jgi:curved DNA-binding protein CbpA
MLPRPSLLLRSIARPASPWARRSCLRPSTARPPQVASRGALFHTTAPCRSDSTPNYYETLQLAPTATAAEIKRQFYALSKKNHPDHNRDDPTASTRFVEISEAYHVLGIPEKRAQYDAKLHQSERRGSGWGQNNGYPQGSYSSAAFGSRPASGLNKKRSTFRGPPPSFYKSGGYGQHGAKRAEYANHNPHAEGQESKEAPNESYGDFGGGFGPGQQKQGNEVPHFDDRRHKETHDSVNEHILGRRRRMQGGVRLERDYSRGGVLLHFVMVSSVIGLIGMTAKIFSDRNEEKEHKRRNNS